MSREQTYGYFPGGAMDPRLFDPDEEVNTPDEMAAWRAACEAWDRGERLLRFEVSGRIVDTTDGCAIVCGSAYGLGTYEIDVEDEDPEPGAEEDVPGEVAA